MTLVQREVTLYSARLFFLLFCVFFPDLDDIEEIEQLSGAEKTSKLRPL